MISVDKLWQRVTYTLSTLSVFFGFFIMRRRIGGFLDCEEISAGMAMNGEREDVKVH